MAPITHTSHRDAAAAFLTLVSSGRVKEAFDTYVSPAVRHHNVYFPGDGASLASAMEENARSNPSKRYQPRMTIEEGDRVMVLGSVRHQPDAPEYALVHLFRFENDRIAEMWDVGQEIPKNSPNGNGAF
jgi:predicted SnoaL-like aldol condensation-catalyzing enzyme